MKNYDRNGSLPQADSFEPRSESFDQDRVSINGFQQIVDMLRVADPAFRESLLRRLSHKDANLAHSLRRDLRLY